MTGVGVDDNIRSAYQFIAQNFVPGDEIYLFGFSRGAFTARSLAGLITACGILFRQSLGALMVWGRANIAEDANSGHATFQCDRTRTRKALDRLSGGVKVR